ncbi:1-deoxy-D-xylulose-5-phosphate reductoisomerase, partial [candidate division FCPU426 bacterium]|nr:1-deoxy-D-xylulose-5-phosphate reductoisomerase [candidate division FCPU426 bacterium]
MTGRKHIVLLGSTGSIGKSALDVIGRHPRRFRIEALAANRNARLILAQTRKYKPARVALAEPAAYRFVRDRVRRWKNPPRVEGGMEGIRRAAVMPAADLVLSAMAGSAGLL